MSFFPPSKEDQEERERFDSRQLRGEIYAVVQDLRALAADEETMGKLHEVERLMVQDVVADSRRLRCEGCLRWMKRLRDKARSLQDV